MYANVPGKGRVATSTLRAWRKEAYREIQAQVQDTFDEQFALTIVLSDVGLKRNRDGDGVIKAIADALVACHIVTDDSYKYMRRVSAIWSSSVEHGRCLVAIRRLAPLAAIAPHTDAEPPSKLQTPKKSKQAVCEAVRKKYGLSISDDRIHVN
jgi:Holliday junction resolvase RusA-like endonuclease